MKNEIVTYEVQLDHPDFYVEFQAEAGLTEDQILTFAIEAMTWKTEVCSVKIKKKGWLSSGVMVKYFQDWERVGWSPNGSATHPKWW